MNYFRGRIYYTEMYDMLKNMDPPLGFGSKCPGNKIKLFENLLEFGIKDFAISRSTCFQKTYQNESAH